MEFLFVLAALVAALVIGIGLGYGFRGKIRKVLQMIGLVAQEKAEDIMKKL